MNLSMNEKSLQYKRNNTVYIITITTRQNKLSDRADIKILSSFTEYTKDSTGGLTRGQVGPRRERESGPSPAPRPQRKTGEEGREGENERSR